MIALDECLEVMEYIEPELARQARRELDGLRVGRNDRSTLVVIGGAPQRIVATEAIGRRRTENSHWMREVPVVIVEKK